MVEWIDGDAVLGSIPDPRTIVVGTVSARRSALERATVDDDGGRLVLDVRRDTEHLPQVQTCFYGDRKHPSRTALVDLGPQRKSVGNHLQGCVERTLIGAS